MALSLALALPVEALAAPPVPPAQQGEVLQRQQQQQIDQDRTRILEGAPGQTVIEVPTHPKASAPPGSCRQIDAIVFADAPHMGEHDKARLTAGYLHRCLGLGDIENLLSDITRFYIGKNQPTTRVYVDTRALEQGKLTLRVVEGRVEKVVLDDGGRHSVNLWTAFGSSANTAFNLRRFEQGLDQINRLASNHATLDLLPGSAAGETVVRITNHPGFPVHPSIVFDNSGQPATGASELAGTVIADNVLHLNDQISFTRRQSIDGGRPNARSTSDTALFSVPFTLLTVSGGYTDSSYRSQSVAASGTVFVLTGTTRSIFGTIDAAVWRGRTAKLSLSATLTSKINRNYLDATYLPVSSRELTVLDLAATYTTLVGPGSLRLTAGYARGLKAFGALDDAAILASSGPPTAGAPHAQFDKADASAFLSMPFKIGKQPFVFTSEVNAQYAFVPVYSSEQIVVGSPFTVRGFRDGSQVGDRGIYARNELGLPLAVPGLARNLRIKPYVGVDAGHVANVANGQAGGTLAGVTGGLALSAGPLSVDAYATRAVAHGGLPTEKTLGFVRVSVAL